MIIKNVKFIRIRINPVHPLSRPGPFSLIIQIKYSNSRIKFSIRKKSKNPGRKCNKNILETKKIIISNFNQL